MSFAPDQIVENVSELVQIIAKLKPASAKGTYMKSITVSSTMGPGIDIDIKSIPGVK